MCPRRISRYYVTCFPPCSENSTQLWWECAPGGWWCKNAQLTRIFQGFWIVQNLSARILEHLSLEGFKLYLDSYPLGREYIWPWFSGAHSRVQYVDSHPSRRDKLLSMDPYIIFESPRASNRLSGCPKSSRAGGLTFCTKALPDLNFTHVQLPKLSRVVESFSERKRRYRGSYPMGLWVKGVRRRIAIYLNFEGLQGLLFVMHVHGFHLAFICRLHQLQGW